MEVVAPTKTVLEVLRGISHAEFAYAPTKALCEAAEWQLVNDEPFLGYLRYSMALGASTEQRRQLSMLVAEKNKPPFAAIPLFCSEEYDKHREPLDLAFRTIADQLAGFFGPMTRSGEYRRPHRADWSFLFAGWSLPDATLVLAQDEFDSQFGMDVTLWVQAAGSVIKAPVRDE